MSFWDNVKKFAQPYADDEYDEYEDGDEGFEEEAAPRPSRRSAAEAAEPAASESGSFSGKVLNMNSNRPAVVLFRPVSFNDATKAADDLRDKKAVIVNLENVDKAISRRVIDFLSGCAYALDGRIKKVALSTYILTPYNVDIVGDLVEELENSGAYL